MTELDEARAELGRLQGVEKTLFKQLLEIRAAIKTQESKIDELVKKGPPAIDRLPVELLARIIFQSLPNYDDHCVSVEFRLVNRRSNLSTVSRLWRNVMLNTPMIWRDVVLDGSPLTVAFLETQLIRSGNVPLNVFIIDTFYKPTLVWLNVLVSAANRWQCLYIHELSLSNMDGILDALEGLKFPSLKDVNIYALKRNHTINPTFIPPQSLTVLSLTGDTTSWLSSGDIHLPLLEVLKLAVGHAQTVMDAIVSPKLLCFDYCAEYRDDHCISFGTGSKFSHVQEVTVDLRRDAGDADAFCEEFRGVRHVTLYEESMVVFFMPNDRDSDLESVPADHWTALESLTIHGGLVGLTEAFECLLRWLTKRQELGRPRLSVRISGRPNLPSDGVKLHELYNTLRTCCDLEMESVALHSTVRCSASNGSFWLDVLGVEPFVTNDILLDCYISNRCSMKTICT
ncbi:hypothetical protein EDC04DRAFT_697198 [Pisolithus marmoratus]|nr:hypothetical protein EDC04DRAFT_697198 [Pisolithus marmoratus]